MTHAHGEDGFTLIEVLVVLVLTLVVGFATLQTLDAFSSNATDQTRRTDANDQARGTMDRVVADLRQVNTLEVTAANELVYTVVDSATVTRRERVCLGTGNAIYRSSQAFSTPPVAPLAAGTACPGATGVQVSSFPSSNGVADPIFRYDAATPATVRNVGITIALDSSRTAQAKVSTLRSSAFVRARRETTKAGPGSVIVTCNSAGPLLTLDSSLGPAAVSYTDIEGMPIGASSGAGVQLTSTLASAGAGTTVVANITNPLGQVSRVVKTVLCTP